MGQKSYTRGCSVTESQLDDSNASIMSSFITRDKCSRHGLEFSETEI